MPDSRPQHPLLMSILGRSLIVVLLTLLGLIGGAIVGVARAIPAIQAIPPAPKTMGFESAGFLPAIIFVVHVALGAAGGAIVGLVIGVAWAILWPRRPDSGD